MGGETGNIREDLSGWFLPSGDSNPVIGNPVLTGNDVTAFIEYRDYYRALADAVSKTSGADHFIYFADWQLNLETWMDAPGGTRKTFRTLLKEADGRGVPTRAILYMGQWAHDPVGNASDCDWINDNLKNGGAILDGRYLIAGSHHQKFAVVKNGDGVVAFCGGMDIAEDRQLRDGGPKPPDTSKPPPWHDVQTRVVGPAALVLWRSFALRWSDYRFAYSRWSDYDASNAAEVSQAAVKVAPVPPTVSGKMSVQVIRTGGNGSRHAGLDNLFGTTPLGMKNVPSTYTFAPTGEMTIYKLICRAIEKTTSTIYLEDQYLVESERMGANKAVPEVLADTISKPSFKKMIILVPGAGSIQGELCQVWLRRTRFWKFLGSSAAAKVKIYAYKYLPNIVPTLVHAKLWIFDDKFAIISSANCNRRSYSHDSEIGVGVADPNAPAGQMPFPQDLRVRLWLKHLNTKGPTRKAADVLDFEGGAKLWDTPDIALEPIDLEHPANSPPDHHVGDVPATVKLGARLKGRLGGFDAEWDYILDPDGS